MDIKYPFINVHTISIEEIIKEFQTNSATGISQAEATRRIKLFGPNTYTAQKTKSVWLIFFLQFKSPIVYLLVVGAAVSFYFGNIIEGAAIVLVIFVNAIIGFLMEMQARSSMHALRKMDVSFSNVIREGKTQQTASEKLTPGDLVLLEAGDIIPADGRLVEINQLQCDESSLTGESLPSAKSIEKLPKETLSGDRHNMVFKGASVINGNGKAIITGIGQHTELGTITSLVETATEPVSLLNKQLGVLSKTLIWITLVFTTLFIITGLIEGKPWMLIFETSIALAVAAFPEGLPVVSTVALAYGMLLMGRRNAIVKKLSSVQTLGSTSVILTDKTGTLTENKIHVSIFSFPGENVNVHMENNELKFDKAEIVKSKENFEKMKLVAGLCNNATEKNTGNVQALSGDPLEISLFHLAETSGTTVSNLQKQYPRIAEVPFSSETKMMATLHKANGTNLVAAKGAVEQLLVKCKRIQTGKSISGLNQEGSSIILAESERLAAEGLRVLAFAYREDGSIMQEDFSDDLIYVGMIGFLDPPRLDIKGAIATCRKAGIKVVMITGDHPLTAQNIARKIGLVDENDQAIITGKELPPMDTLSIEWHNKILNTSIFARTTPKQKLELAGFYQAEGNVVAMTGDGVNDAPALKKADVGIAMGLRGTQVAKETASIVLKDDSFNSIAAAVAHGREIFRNIQKFVIYLVSCNLSEIFIVTAVGFFSPAATILPLQILFLNMVTDVFPALALGVGEGDKTVMDVPPRNPSKAIISKSNWVAILIYAAVITLSVVAAILYCKRMITIDAQVENNVAFITLAFAQLFHVFNMSSPRSGLFNNEVTGNKFVWLAILFCTGLMLLVFAVPAIRLALDLVILPAKVWMICIVAALLPVVLLQVYKITSRIIMGKAQNK